jgi:hypothetical protein
MINFTQLRGPFQMNFLDTSDPSIALNLEELRVQKIEQGRLRMASYRARKKQKELAIASSQQPPESTAGDMQSLR